MKKLSTDLEILNCIFAEYADAFLKYRPENATRDTKIYVPIDVLSLASKLNNDPDILFGRFYYHLDHKYRYKQDNGSLVHLFAFAVGDDKHCINYPYLSAILSEQKEILSNNRKIFWLAIAALILSIGSIIAQVVTSVRGGA